MPVATTDSSTARLNAERPIQVMSRLGGTQSTGGRCRVGRRATELDARLERLHLLVRAEETVDVLDQIQCRQPAGGHMSRHGLSLGSQLRGVVAGGNSATYRHVVCRVRCVR